MEDQVANWFAEYSGYAIWLSIFLNIIISLLGIVPSVFLTAANIMFFGFLNGVTISILGEALGAIISFYLYRKGIRRFLREDGHQNRYIKKLQKSKGLEAFLLILALRLFPLVPSGFVTLAGAASKMTLVNFSIASTIGKVPALLLEAYSVQQVLHWEWQGKVIAGIVSLFFLLVFLRKKGPRKR
ncbi:TVP38/TMEM64 family protein [Peribacillus glennii]|uniref:TVP38/TMEM64 family membrane protein n=1 Tax=Peribacillus glennii TaxID=2303991 RepID=A0A372LED0_9BACI|nr:VTT domain-containing protein [Peribacillus glennii]RFU64016.1 TVP38/TMEM64 family protein [Peribacillus glennii]